MVERASMRVAAGAAHRVRTTPSFPGTPGRFEWNPTSRWLLKMIWTRVGAAAARENAENRIIPMIACKAIEGMVHKEGAGRSISGWHNYRIYGFELFLRVSAPFGLEAQGAQRHSSTRSFLKLFVVFL